MMQAAIDQMITEMVRAFAAVFAVGVFIGIVGTLLFQAVVL